MIVHDDDDGALSGEAGVAQILILILVLLAIIALTIWIVKQID